MKKRASASGGCWKLQAAVSNSQGGLYDRRVRRAAAALADDSAGGEPTARMAHWAGQRLAPVSMAEVGSRLAELGPGSLTVVGFDRRPGAGGHWFNAVNDQGTVLAVDGQSGMYESWLPSVGGLGFEEGEMRLVPACRRGSGSRGLGSGQSAHGTDRGQRPGSCRDLRRGGRCRPLRHPADRSPTSQVRRPTSMAPVAVATSAKSSGATKSARARLPPQSIEWPGPAMKPSSNIHLFTTTLPLISQPPSLGRHRMSGPS
jgi:hypothetical protein